MTASKSSRARNARAAARSGAGSRGGTAARSGTAGQGAARTVPAAKPSPATAKGAAVKNGVGAGNVNGAANGSTAGTARTHPGSARGAAPGRGGARTPVAQEQTPTATGPALWMQLLTFVLALAGLGVSTYLTIAHFTQSTLLGCSETSGTVNCTKVTTSAQSYFLGIPVAVLGLVFFAFVVAIMSPWAWRAARREIHIARILAMVAGIGFVIWLLYAELFIIGNICLYCTSVHIITFVLFVLTVFAAAAWGLRPGVRRSPKTSG